MTEEPQELAGLDAFKKHQDIIESYASSENKQSWEPYVKDIENKRLKSDTIVLLENQRLFNGMTTAKLTDQQVENTYQIVSKVYPNLLSQKLVCVQPMLSPASITYGLEYKYDRPKTERADDSLDVIYPKEDYKYEPEDLPKIRLEIVEHPIACKTRKVTLNCSYDNIDQFSLDLINEIDREVLKDIYNNCGTVASMDGEVFDKSYLNVVDDPFYLKISEVMNVIHRKTLMNHNHWIVVGLETYSKHMETFKYYNTGYGRCSGRVYVVDHFEPEDVLIGSCGSNVYDMGGYYYCPYIPIGPTPVVDPEKNIQPPNDGKFRFLTRYGKRLARTGAKSYARIQRAK